MYSANDTQEEPPLHQSNHLSRDRAKNKVGTKKFKGQYHILEEKVKKNIIIFSFLVNEI